MRLCTLPILYEFKLVMLVSLKLKNKLTEIKVQESTYFLTSLILYGHFC